MIMTFQFQTSLSVLVVWLSHNVVLYQMPWFSQWSTDLYTPFLYFQSMFNYSPKGVDCVFFFYFFPSPNPHCSSAISGLTSFLTRIIDSKRVFSLWKCKANLCLQDSTGDYYHKSFKYTWYTFFITYSYLLLLNYLINVNINFRNRKFVP